MAKQPQYTIGFLAKLIPRSFDGKQIELHDFLVSCNAAMELAAEEQCEALLAVIITKIEGNAKRQLANFNFRSWDELKTCLKRIYPDVQHFHSLQEELATITQEYNESVTEYYNRIDKLVGRCIAELENVQPNEGLYQGYIEGIKELARSRFIYHSKEQLSQVLQWKQFDTINEAFSAAVMEEKFLGRKEPVTKTSKYCSICKNRSHNTNECYRCDPTKKVSKSDELLTYTYCKNTGNTIGESQKRMRNNQAQPIIIANNPQAQEDTKICKYRKKTGHLISEYYSLRNKNKHGEAFQQASGNNSLKTFSSNVNPIQEPPYRNNQQQSPLYLHQLDDQAPYFQITRLTLDMGSANLMNAFLPSLNSQRTNKLFKFLLDPGAVASLVKWSRITIETIINPSIRYKVVGIAAGIRDQTIGQTELVFKFTENTVTHPFQVLSDIDTIPYDGILGNDFFRQHGALFDYYKQTLALQKDKVIIDFAYEDQFPTRL